MKRRKYLAASIVLAGAIQVGAQPAATTPSLIQRSGFIFRGTVQKAGASNVKALPESPNTVIVRVDEILKSPAILEPLRGREVTVQLQRPATVKEKQQAVFFTTGWLYGENVAVKEVGTVSGAVNSKTLTDQIAQSTQLVSEQALGARIASATLIVTGKVIDVKATISQEDSLRRSEHDPELWIATIDIDAVLKGQKPDSSAVPVLFAHSTDERWLQSPKYTPGQQGIFLLHDESKLIGQRGFATLDQLDFQPSSQLDLVRRIINSRR